jgi:pyridoxal 5'-phosphate synthase pdxT subunit
MDIGVERNAYGRQIDSRVTEIDRAGVRTAHRAGKAGSGLHSRPHHPPRGSLRPRAHPVSGRPRLVEEGRHLAATFHPELTSDPRVHSLFLEKL